MGELPPVLGSVKVAARFCDEAVSADPPLLEAADMNALASAARSCIGACERPAKDKLLSLDRQIVHVYLHVREGGHESLGLGSNGITADRRRTTVDTERSPKGVTGSDTRGILAAPRRGIALREIP